MNVRRVHEAFTLGTSVPVRHLLWYRVAHTTHMNNHQPLYRTSRPSHHLQSPLRWFRSIFPSRRPLRSARSNPRAMQLPPRLGSQLALTVLSGRLARPPLYLMMPLPPEMPFPATPIPRVTRRAHTRLNSIPTPTAPLSSSEPRTSRVHPPSTFASSIRSRGLLLSRVASTSRWRSFP